jgi:Zn-dependent protease with chaperone function
MGRFQGGYRRGSNAFNATLVAMLAIVVLTWLLSLALVAPLGFALGWLARHGEERAGLAGALVAALVWSGSAGLVLLRPVEAAFARLLFPVRRPSPEELARLAPVWHRACARCGDDPAAYTLRIEERQVVNAFALGRHFVAVTRVALDLPDDLLEAVIAHELGHHHGLHPVAAMLGWWYLMPLEALGWCLRQVRAATAATARAYSRLRGHAGYISAGRAAGGALGVVGLLLLAAALVAAGALLLVALGALWLPLWLLSGAAKVLAAALSRAAELAADRHATALGYGASLTRMLELLAHDGRAQPARRRSVTALLASHPTFQARIQAIRRGEGARPRR